ncbi:hypothetical protein [Nocardia aurantia]|uniref:Uncharacterized protein n=1 Tax=Nocardia aurantia TaxID=2585199 RepID=A0A7K0DWC3_9NOCA|nr:hypothetical protein [Nocardia aurantia]MQY29134.1 hypothetical protein [Nocardia aurantia]
MVLRGVRSSSAVLLAAAAAVIAFGVPAWAEESGADSAEGLPPGFPCGHTTVSPLSTSLWFPLDGRAPRYAEGTQASGTGYLDMYAPPGGRTNYFHPGINTRLSDLAAGPQNLGFMHQGQYVSFQLRLRLADRTDTDRSGFTTLVWWPPANGDVGAANWATSDDLVGGRWWSTQPIQGLAGGQSATATLPEIAQNNPHAIVTEYGVFNDSGTGAADRVVYGCRTWDFEPLANGSA